MKTFYAGQMHRLFKAPMALVTALIGLGFILAAPAQAQSLAVGSTTGLAGSTVDLSVDFIPDTTAVSTLQFDLNLSSSLVYVSTTTGSAATAAEKSATGSTISGGVRVLVFGLNQKAIGSGTVAIVRLIIASNTPPQVIPVTITGITASDPDGNGTSVFGSAGNVTINAPPDTTSPTLAITSA